MVGTLRKVSFQPAKMLGVCLIALGAVLYYEHHRSDVLADSNKNYSLVYATPPGWRAIPHSPEALFLYKNPANNLLIRGAMSDVVADYNPDPDLDRDGTAKWMLDVTHENLSGWNGEMQEVIDAKGATFRMVRRWKTDKCVISAVAVRGNTTIIVTLSADKPEMRYIDAALPQFRQYVSTLAFKRHIWAD